MAKIITNAKTRKTQPIIGLKNQQAIELITVQRATTRLPKISRDLEYAFASSSSFLMVFNSLTAMLWVALIDNLCNAQSYYAASHVFSCEPLMPTFQCKKCDKKVEADYAGCHCTHSHGCHEQKPPECCGQPMLEIIDD